MMDKQEVTMLVLLDLNTDINTINHGIMLTMLESIVGITGTAFDWYQLYLVDRNQVVLIAGETSDAFHLKYDISQG